MARKYSSAPSKNGFAVFLGVIVAAVLVLAVVAVKGKIADNVKKNRLASGNMLVSDYSDQKGMAPEELIAAYGLKDDKNIKKNSKMDDFIGALTLKNYVNFLRDSDSDFAAAMSDVELTAEAFEAFKAEKGTYGADVTIDTKDAAVKQDYVSYVMLKKQQADALEAAMSGDNAEDAAGDAEVPAAE